MSSEKKNAALTAGIGYTVGNILIKGINILTLPIFSRLMTQEEFGVFNVFMSYDAILLSSWDLRCTPASVTPIWNSPERSTAILPPSP